MQLGGLEDWKSPGVVHGQISGIGVWGSPQAQKLKRFAHLHIIFSIFLSHPLAFNNACEFMKYVSKVHYMYLTIATPSVKVY